MPDKDGYTDDPADQLMKKNADASKAKRSDAGKAFAQGMQNYSRNQTQDALNLLRPTAGAPRAQGSSVPALDLPSFKRGGTMKRKGVARLHRGEKAQGRKSKGR